MAIPPPVTRTEFEQALRRIHGRRRAAGDDDPFAMSEDPSEVLLYLRKRGSKRLVEDGAGPDAHNDASDALILNVWRRQQVDADDLWILEASEARRWPRRRTGHPLGLTRHGQSVVDRIRLLRARCKQEAVVSAPVAASSRDEQIRELAADLVAQRRAIPEDIADEIPLMVVTEALPDWRPGAPPRDEGVIHALRWLLGDLDPVTPAGTALRAAVDRGIELVGAQTIPG
jgi:hypothetical protein